MYSECSKFIELIHIIASTVTTRPERKQPYWGNHSVEWVGYADNIKMFFETKENLQKAITFTGKIFKKFNCQINVSWTKQWFLISTMTEYNT